MNEYIDDKLIENTYLFCVKRISDSEEAKEGDEIAGYLAKPEDYNCSAAGLMLVKWEGNE